MAAESTEIGKVGSEGVCLTVLSEGSTTTSQPRPLWEMPEMTVVEINVATGCCYALGGNDGTPSVTSIS